MGGIVDFDIRFPGSRVTVQDMHRDSGLSVDEILEITHCRSFPALGADEQIWFHAAAAARTVLDRTGVPPESIGKVIFAGSGEWDTPFWSPAAKVADELGIQNAHCFEVVNFCNAAMTAIQIAVDTIMLGRTEYVLVLAGDRLSRMVDHGDAGSKALFNFGDAAAAVLLAAERCTFAFLHSEMRTDPGWSDYYFGERGPDGVVIRRGPHRDGLGDAYVDNFVQLVKDNLTSLGRVVSDVSCFLINHGDKAMHERLMAAIGIPSDLSVYNYHRLGHMGAADTLIALRDLVAAGRLRRGDLILLATSAMGFSWGVTALEFSG